MRDFKKECSKYDFSDYGLMGVPMMIFAIIGELFLTIKSLIIDIILGN